MLLLVRGRSHALLLALLSSWRAMSALPVAEPGHEAGGDTDSTRSGTIAVDGHTVVTVLPKEMSGAGCGIEYLNHEINGGLYSQLILDESFEYAFNASTGLTQQWLAGATNTTTLGSAVRLVRNSTAALNGRQYVQLVAEPRSPAQDGDRLGGAWAENRGVNRWGLSWADGKAYGGSVWLSNPRGVGATVRVAMTCGTTNHSTGTVLASVNFSVPQNSGWREYKMELVPTGACRPEASGGYLVDLLAPMVAQPVAGSESGAAVVNVDFVTLHPGDWGRYHGQPVRKDLATMLFDGMGVPLLRFGGGTINAREIGDDDAKNATGWGLGYSWRHMRGPRWERPPMEFVNPNIRPEPDQISYASNGFGIFEFLDLCKQANVSAVLSINEKDDGDGFIEYLWGDNSTTYGALRHRDGHPQPYQTEHVWFQLGNERVPTRTPWCAKGNCTAADLRFALAALRKAKELGLASSLRLVLAYTSKFNPESSTSLRELVVACGRSGISLTWDQHIDLSSSELSSVYREGWPAAVYSMGETTKQWAPAAYPDGIRTVVLEENGNQAWNVNIHGLRRALNHAQVVSGLQRVPAPLVDEAVPHPTSQGKEIQSQVAMPSSHWASQMRRKAAHTLPPPAPGWKRLSRGLPGSQHEPTQPRSATSQVVMSTQANCLQADGQNYYCPPPDGHANSWDQGTIFYNSAGEIWGQPTFYSAQMMSKSHQPYVVQSEYRDSANNTAMEMMSSDDDQRHRNAAPAPANWSTPTGLDVISLRSQDGTALTIRVVNPQSYSITALVQWGRSFAPPPGVSAMVSVLTSMVGGLNDSNVATDQNRVVPKVTQRAIHAEGLMAPLRFPNGSFTTIVVAPH